MAIQRDYYEVLGVSRCPSGAWRNERNLRQDLKPFANQEEVRHFLYPCIPVHSRTFSRRNRERLDRAQPYTPKGDCVRASFHAGIVNRFSPTAFQT